MKEKLIYWLTILLIIFLPTQLGRHFWYDGALIMGRRIDYLAPVIYLTDIIIFGLFLVWWATTLGKFGRFGGLGKLGKPTLLLLGILFAGNLWSAENKIITAWYFLKIAEYVWLGWFIINQIKNNSPCGCHPIWRFLVIPVIYESVLAIWQVIGQKSVGGIWWWLGERSFSAATPGIAQFVWHGELFLRGYGTFPHPNVLAGFLLIALIILSKISLRYWLKVLVFLTGFLSIFVSGSRLIWGLVAVWGVWEIISKINNFSPAIHFCFLCSPPRSRFRNTSGVFPVVAFGVLLCIFAIVSYVNFSDPSVVLRLKLNGIALQMFADHWLFGVGLMNFVVQLPNYTRDFEVLKFLQPAHNVGLLFLAETGIFGVGFLTVILISHIRRISLIRNEKQNLFLLLAIVIISLFDHYFWTTQQGQLLTTIVVVYLLSINSKLKIKN